MEIEKSEEEEEEVEEEQEKLEGGKRREVVRRGRFFRAGGSLDVDKLIQLLESLSPENKALCMRSLGGSDSCSDASDSKRDENSVNAKKKLVTQEDSMDTPSG